MLPSRFVIADQTNPGSLERFFTNVAADYRHHYSSDKLLQLGMVVGVSGIMANTNIDSSFHDRYQLDYRGETSNSYSSDFTSFGDGAQLVSSIPLYLGVLLLGETTDNTTTGQWLGTWATRSLRSLIVGAPQQAALTRLLGSGRPTEGDSDWDFLDQDNAVSGHAFYSAVPILTAAGMVDNPAGKYTLYALSVFPGLSRVNDEKHYLSQVFLGWSLAYMAVDTVETVSAKRQRTLTLYPASDGFMLGFNLEF